MDIREFKKEKLKLDKDIGQLLTDFTKKTTIKITDICLSNVDVFNKGEIYNKVLYNIYTDIKI